jgi:hypothetical protein
MGYNVTPKGDGSYKVEDDGAGCGCLIAALLFVGGFILIAGAKIGGGSVALKIVGGIWFILMGISLYKKYRK